jgi:hypothetical protein
VWLGDAAGRAVPDEAAAANADCDSPIGGSSVSNDFDDSVSCECSDGSGASAAANEWPDSLRPSQPICPGAVDLFCGEGPPPPGVPCETRRQLHRRQRAGSREPRCSDGSGAFGGNDWIASTTTAPFDVCLEQAASSAGPLATE